MGVQQGVLGSRTGCSHGHVEKSWVWAGQTRSGLPEERPLQSHHCAEEQIGHEHATRMKSMSSVQSRAINSGIKGCLGTLTDHVPWAGATKALETRVCAWDKLTEWGFDDKAQFYSSLLCSVFRGCLLHSEFPLLSIPQLLQTYI